MRRLIRERLRRKGGKESDEYDEHDKRRKIAEKEQDFKGESIKHMRNKGFLFIKR